MSVLIGLQRPVCEDEDEEQSAEEEQKLIIDPCREHDGQHRSYFLNVDGTAVVEGSAIFKFLVSQRILRPRPLAGTNSAPALKAALSWLSVKNGQLENTKTTDLPRPLRFGCAVAVSTPHSWTVSARLLTFTAIQFEQWIKNHILCSCANMRKSAQVHPARYGALFTDAPAWSPYRKFVQGSNTFHTDDINPHREARLQSNLIPFNSLTTLCCRFHLPPTFHLCVQIRRVPQVQGRVPAAWQLLGPVPNLLVPGPTTRLTENNATQCPTRNAENIDPPLGKAQPPLTPRHHCVYVFFVTVPDHQTVQMLERLERTDQSVWDLLLIDIVNTHITA
ncbi:hypothetical protein C8F04DRAFT_1184882, partial [Mycena alexandri]